MMRILFSINGRRIIGWKDTGFDDSPGADGQENAGKNGKSRASSDPGFSVYSKPYDLFSLILLGSQELEELIQT
ncbi:hypothetical protein, partial [Siphonobacter sp. BAB-5385]|uniref:hypothetical protein n=1 Tax=Siphonobacter sp. BAB-5385 TaxID=1864822 RepID=UPI001C3D403C